MIKKQLLAKILHVGLSVVGGVMVLECLILILMGKINFGSVVPLLIGLIFLAHGLYWQWLLTFIERSRGLKRIWMGLWGVFALWCISFGMFIGSLQQQIKSSQQTPPQVAAVIVLGSGTVDGKPTRTLAARLDAAAPIIKQQQQAVAITSGGVGFGRTRSEADIMATYLAEQHGIAKDRIIQEGKSTSTHENMMYSKDILIDKGISVDAPVAIVTSDFHTIRSKAIARRQGLTQPITIASPTPLPIRYNAWFREYFAYVSGWLLNEY